MNKRRRFALLLSCVGVVLATVILLLPDQRSASPVTVALAPVLDDSIALLPVATTGQPTIHRVEVTPANGISVDVMVVSADRQTLDNAVVTFRPLPTGEAALATLNDAVYRAKGLPIDRAMMLSVTAPGFATYLRQVRVSASTTMEVRLEPALTIAGKVTLPDGSRPPVKVIVYAVPTADLNGHWLEWLRLTRDGVKGLPHCATNEAGEFEIPDVDPSSDYTLLCGGSGWVGGETHPAIRPGGSRIELVLWRAYGCLVQLTALQGRLPDSDFASASHSAHPFPNARVTVGRSWEAVVVQGGCTWRFDEDDWQRRLLLVKSPTISGQLGSMGLTYDVPGYDSLSATVQIPAISADTLLEANLQLRPWAVGFGMVRAKFRTPYQLPEVPGAMTRSAVLLTLRSLDTNLTFERAVPRPSSEQVQVIGLPHGTYEVFLRSTTGTWNADIQGSRVLTVSDEPVDIDYELPDTGSLVVRVDGNGRKGVYCTSVALARDDGVTFLVDFESSPYILECIPLGHYRMVVRQHDESHSLAAVARMERVTIEPGRVTECEVNPER